MTGDAPLPVLPTVTTTAVSPYSSTTGTGGGNVTSNGGETLIAKGICWSITSNPTTSNYKTNDGTTSGSYSSSMTGLYPSTLYYVRAYATNRAGTTYGDQVTFTTSALAVGQSYQGGIIAYLNANGGGLITTTSNTSTGAPWGCEGTETYATYTGIGYGDENTGWITGYCTSSGIAAQICSDLVSGGYSDWSLPSKDELAQLYTNRVAIGGFTSTNYWSSTESNASYAWYQNFSSGSQNTQNKSNSTYYVRAVREIIGVGRPYQGGIIIYMFAPGEPGYVAGEFHGLIASTADLGAGTTWGCNTTLVSGAAGTAIGTGNQNTLDIISGCGTANIPADLCADYSVTEGGVTYSDWYLPSKDELDKVYLKKSVLSGISSTIYWSSTQNAYNSAYGQNFSTGAQSAPNKNNTYKVRAVRTF